MENNNQMSIYPYLPYRWRSSRQNRLPLDHRGKKKVWDWFKNQELLRYVFRW